jgi:hypothetical protein
MNLNRPWNKPTLCTFTGIVARGLQNAYYIGDLGRTYPGGDHRDDRRF